MIKKWRVEIEFVDKGYPGIPATSYLLKRDIEGQLEYCFEKMNTPQRFYKIKKIKKEK